MILNTRQKGIEAYAESLQALENYLDEANGALRNLTEDKPLDPRLASLDVFD